MGFVMEGGLSDAAREWMAVSVMQPESGCDEIDLSLEWVHVAQAH